MKEKDYRKGCCTGHRQGEEEGEEEEEEAAKEEEKIKKKERKTYLYVKRYEVHYWKPWFGKWSLGELITVEIEDGKHRKW